jgi:hypothetical protein
MRFNLKESFMKIEKPIRKYFIFSIVDFFVGSLGMLLYGIFTRTYGPIWVRNQYIGLWLLTIIFFSACEAFYLELKDLRRFKKRSYYFDMIYFGLISFLTFLMAIFFIFSGKVDAIIWSFYISAVNLTSVYVIYSRTKRQKKSSKIQQRLITANNAELQAENGPFVDESLNYPKKCNRVERIFKIANIVLRIIFLAVVIFLLVGAIEIGVGRLK